MKLRYALAAIPAFVTAPAVAQDEVCSMLDGSVVVADDGTYLGRISSPYDRESIFNEIGPYGSSISTKSIWNDVGRYGSEISSTSARNEIASRPPMLIKDKEVIGHLTTNEIKRGAINPTVLGVVCYGFKPS